MLRGPLKHLAFLPAANGVSSCRAGETEAAEAGVMRGVLLGWDRDPAHPPFAENKDTLS